MSCKINITWREIDRLTDYIAGQIGDLKFDKIIGIMRGGAIPSVVLSHKLGVQAYTIGIKTYEGDIQTDKIEIYGLDPVFYVNCKNKRILIVDDICDSGQSIQILKDLFDRITTIPPMFATLYYKPTAIVRPDWYGEETTNYIVFPWEKK